jgi:hypothetical protein
VKLTQTDLFLLVIGYKEQKNERKKKYKRELFIAARKIC